MKRMQHDKSLPARAPSATKRMLGLRRSRGELTPTLALQLAQDAKEWVRQHRPTEYASLGEMKTAYAKACRNYYTICAVSRRGALEPQTRDELLSQLFGLRAGIEKAVLSDLGLLASGQELHKLAYGPSFFGVSAKQGVSIRYPLATCVPTSECGGRCYAHDGRDRELHILFRGVLNYWVGLQYEHGSAADKKLCLSRLSKAIDRAIDAALLESDAAAAEGYVRSPRIRFSHVGEMVATPSFTNALAGEIVRRCPEMACVIYTRHPKAAGLDGSMLRINFTIERSGDSRLKYAPVNARVVSSAWDGEISEDAEINFLEHHVGRHAGVSRNALAIICPVTSDSVTKTCDTARCDKCFRPPRCSAG